MNTYHARPFFIIFFPLLLYYMNLLLLFIISLGTVVAFAASPALNIFVLAFSTPIIAWNFTWASFEIPFSDIIAIFSVLVVLGAVLLNFKKYQNKLYLPLFFPFLLFIASYLISLLNYPQAFSGLYYIIRWLILLYFAYLLIPSILIKDEKKLKITLWSLALSSLLVTISGYLSLLGQDWRDSFFRLNAISIKGIYPYGSNHNLIAEFLVAGAFIWLAIKEFYSNNQRRIFDVLFLLSLVAAILSFSRAAWISIFLQLSVWIYWKNKHNFKKYASFWLLTVISTVIILLPLFWRMQILQTDNLSSTENRWLLTEIAYETWQEKPLIGHGAGYFMNIVADNIRFTAKYGEAIDSHGFLQKIAVESGLIGLFSWLFLLSVIIKKAVTSLRRYQNQAPYLLPLWLAAGGAMIIQIFNTSYFKGKVWLIISIALIASKLVAEKYGKKD